LKEEQSTISNSLTHEERMKTIEALLAKVRDIEFKIMENSEQGEPQGHDLPDRGPRRRERGGKVNFPGDL
jgi:hypothetical protein